MFVLLSDFINKIVMNFFREFITVQALCLILLTATAAVLLHFGLFLSVRWSPSRCAPQIIMHNC